MPRPLAVPVDNKELDNLVDVIVVGMGPGGEAVAGELATAGLSVVGVERGLVGGECPYYGCIPSKMMIRGANVLAEARRAPALSGVTTVEPDFTKVATRIRDEATDNWDDSVAAVRFTDKGGQLIRGTGRMTGPKQVTIEANHGKQIFNARLGVVLNPGSDPAVPEVPGLSGTPFWTNREAVKATSAPQSLAVVGGGPIGVELAQAFARFGTKVTILVRGSVLVPREEPEAATLLAEVFANEGIDVRFGTEVASVDHGSSGFQLTLASKSTDESTELTSQTLGVEKLLYAIGRSSTLGLLTLDEAGIFWDGKHPPATDGHLQMAPNVYLTGDAVGAGAFTHMSMYHADVVVKHILAMHTAQPAPHEVDNHAVPRVTFTDPEIGAVGLSEAAAKAAGLDVATAYGDLSTATRGWIHKVGNDGFIKVVMDKGTGVLVGATSVGPMGGEVLSMLALAVHAKIPVETLKSMIYAYPTFHRAIPSVLANFTS